MSLRHYYILLIMDCISVLIIFHASCSGTTQMFHVDHCLHTCNKVLVVYLINFVGFLSFKLTDICAGFYRTLRVGDVDYL